MGKSRKTNRKSTTRVMRGGFTPDEENQLRTLGVSDDMIAQFASENLAFNDIVQAVNEMIQEGEEIHQMQQGPQVEEQEVNNYDNNSTHSSLHLSDLDGDSLASGETTHERNIFSDDDISSDEEDENLHGGRKRRTMKRRKTQKRRATRRQRGGDVFYSDKQRKHLIELGILHKNLKKWQEAKFPYGKAVNYLNDHADNYTDKQKRQLKRKGWSSEHIEKYNGEIPFELLVNENPKQRNPAKNSNSSTDIEEERFSDVPFNSDRTSTGRSISNKKTRKTKSSQKGGACYGNGVGANSNDPNFSIYNTRELELFPYKPF
jgi:hypothetical protein